MQRSKTLRLIGAAAALALFATACSSDDGGDEGDPVDQTETPTDGETGDSEPPAASSYDWSDVRLRQAVSMAIDRQAITDTIFLGARTPADDWWPATFAGYRGGDFCGNLQYNPEAAKALFDEAGGDQGPITFWFNSGSGHEEWVEAVSNQLKENLGVAEVAFESLEFADYLDRYVDHFKLNVRLGARVSALRRIDGGLFEARLADGSVIASRSVIIATGGFQQPFIPALDRGLGKSVLRLTADTYRDPSQVPPGSVLIVGDGASGRDIAVELAGTHRTLLATGKPRRLFAERIFGKTAA